MGMLEVEIVVEDDPDARAAIDAETARILRAAARRRHRSCLGDSWIPSVRLAKRRALAEMRRLGDADHELGGEA